MSKEVIVASPGIRLLARKMKPAAEQAMVGAHQGRVTFATEFLHEVHGGARRLENALTRYTAETYRGNAARIELAHC